MTYTLENIYRDFGQLDKVVTLSFAQGSDSFKEYPDCMTGIFQYAREEREELEISTLDKNQQSHGFVKFKELLNEVSDSKKLRLLQTGINSSDIIFIFHFELRPSKNEFISRDIRKLPEPFIIESDLTYFDSDSFLIGSNNSRLAHGCILTPDEEFENIGIRLRINKVDIDSVTDKTLIDRNTGKLKEPILHFYLLSKQKSNIISSEEKEMLAQIEAKHLIEQTIIINSEIKKSLKNWKQLNEYRPQLELIAKHLFGFRSKRYTNDKFPVWIDLERLAHILLAHVSEINIGEVFKDKSKFQYIIDDIHSLIDTVIGTIEPEIQNHFRKNPEKPFKRHGKMAVYFKGDYYVIDIDRNGKLMTFYKQK